jgi:hypothetical protein
VKSLTFYFLLLSTLMLAGCAAPIPLPQDVSLQKTVLLPFKINSIHLVDMRKDTASVDMNLPTFSTRPKEWTIKPPFISGLKNEVMDMIQHASNPEGLPVDLTLSIVNGYYRIAGDARKVGEHAFFDCLMKFDSKELGRNWTISSNANADYVGAFNATESHARESYRIVVRNSVYKALKKGETVFDESR